MKIDAYHLANKVPIFIKAQSITESSEQYTVEEIISVKKELEEYSKQILEIRNKIFKLAHDKWTKTTS